MKNAAVWDGVGVCSGVEGCVLLLPRIGTAKGSSLDQSEDLAWLELGMVSLEGNPTAEKSEINGACLGLRAGEHGLR